jgi:transcription elongation factor GreB
VSKAFTKEDDEIPEEIPGRHRSSSGLPPGAVNYMTEAGAQRLRKELAHARGRRAEDLRHILESATVVPEHEGTPKEALFGMTVTVRKPDGTEAAYRIVGADEIGMAPGWVSWVSPLARALIGGRVGHRVHLPDSPAEENAQIVKLEN